MPLEGIGGRGMTKLPRKGEYWVNEAETILVCMLADTASAKTIRAELIEIVMAWRRGRLLPHHKAPQFLKLMRRSTEKRYRLTTRLPSGAPENRGARRQRRNRPL